MDIEEFAGMLYESYCQQVGGVAWNGDNLPLWKEFRSDPTKYKQSDAWVVVARNACAYSVNVVGL
jgi:hypothetical protein